MRSSLYFAAIAAFIGTGVIAGDNGDEFSNNLFTDLAPYVIRPLAEYILTIYTGYCNSLGNGLRSNLCLSP
jgi:hypothetical protein